MIAVERTPVFAEKAAELYAYKAVSDDEALDRAITDAKANPYSLIPWPSAQLLLPTLIERLEGEKGRIVDVGAGTGILSLALASAGHSLLATDVDEGALALLERAAFEQQLTLKTMRLDLFSDAERLASLGDVFVMADVLYDLQLASTLVKVSCELLRARKKICVISPPRLGRQRYVEGMKDAGFSADFEQPSPASVAKDIGWWWA